MNIKEVLADKTNYGATRASSSIKYIVIHYTGNDGDMDEGNVSYFQGANRKASAHYFVDDDSVTRSVQDNIIAWHCGTSGTYYHSACRNANSIGVEMCDTVKDGSYNLSNATKANVVGLVKSLMDKYGIGIDNVVRHYDVTHKKCPAYLVDETAWKTFKAEIVESKSITGLTLIMGESVLTVAQMVSYIKSVNPNVAQSVIDMIPFYISEGNAEGVRGDVAFVQSCVETGNFAFSDTAVTLDQNNFCGLGVTSKGMKGNSFGTPQLGIRAQIQHLKAYATIDILCQTCIDPRYKYVTKGCAAYVDWLGIQENPSKKGWAAGANYGSKILVVISKINNLGSTNSVSSTNTATTTVQSTVTPVSFKVRVTADSLRIRKGPGTNYAQVGSIKDKGIYTIIKTSNNWGYLLSGDGWISLDCTEKV